MVKKLSDVIYVLRKPRRRKFSLCIMIAYSHSLLVTRAGSDTETTQNHPPETLDTATIQFAPGTSSSEDDVVTERRAIPPPRSPVEDDGVSSNSDTSSSDEAERVYVRHVQSQCLINIRNVSDLVLLG